MIGGGVDPSFLSLKVAVLTLKWCDLRTIKLPVVKFCRFPLCPVPAYGFGEGVCVSIPDVAVPQRTEPPVPNASYLRLSLAPLLGAFPTAPEVTERTTTGLSLPATKPNP